MCTACHEFASLPPPIPLFFASAKPILISKRIVRTDNMRPVRQCQTASLVMKGLNRSHTATARVGRRLEHGYGVMYMMAHV